MANFHLEVDIISRGKKRPFARAVNYISGQRMRDDYTGQTYYRRRQDVLHLEIIRPDGAPPEFGNLQSLCSAVDKAEKRYDSRTARGYKGSLQNELPVSELAEEVREFVDTNFTSQGLCAIVAIHEGRNIDNPEKNNPHFHIIVPDRPVGSDGFCKKKNREFNKKKYIRIWRESLADILNRAYERNGLALRVSHESNEVLGRDSEPTIHLNRADWEREKNGQSTPRGDEKRAVKGRNQEREEQKRRRQQERQRDWDRDMER